MKKSVKTLQEITDFFWSKVEKTADCWLWKGRLNPQGYGDITWRNRRWLAHRFAWFLTKGVGPEKCLLHRCDNPQCVRPDHLFEGTRQDNMADKVAKNRQHKGETCPLSKLSNVDVMNARNLYAAGVSQTAIANGLQVDPSTISNIVRRKTWSHI